MKMFFISTHLRFNPLILTQTAYANNCTCLLHTIWIKRCTRCVFGTFIYGFVDVLTNPKLNNANWVF